MENIQRFGDAMTSVGVFILRREDDALLYFNKTMGEMQPGLRLGGKGSELFPKVFKTVLEGPKSELERHWSVRYVKEWDFCAKVTAEDYLWEETQPAYLVTVIPAAWSDTVKEAERYSQVIEKTAMAISKLVACCNLTQGTFTQYGESKINEFHQSTTWRLDESYARLAEAIHPEDKEEFEKKFSLEELKNRLRRGEKEVYGEYRERQNDRYIWISVRCIPLENPFDEDELCLFVMRDINRRKQMELQLAIQLNATYQAIPGGVVIMQMDDRMSIINASQSFYEMMGKSVEDYDNGYRKHILPEDLPEVQRKIRAMAELGAPFDIIYREADAKQRLHWVQARGVKISDEDGCPVYLIIRMDVTELKDAQQELIEEQKQYRIYTEGIIDTLSNLVEFRDLDSGEHIKRTRTLTRILLHKLRERNSDMLISDDSIEKIAEAAALHDVGKIVISDTILNKPGKLTIEEFEAMKQHTVKGYEILKTLNFSQDEEQRQYSLDISRYHHERWDGNGYPDHLRGEEIPIWSQVVSIVDVYDALVSQRVYKKAYSHEKALEMILNGECGCFNPELLDCLKESVELLEQEYNHVCEKSA